MSDDWPNVELANLMEAERGVSYGIVQPGKPAPGGVPLVRVSDVRHGRIDTRTPLHVAPEVETAYARTRLRGGELLITIVGTVGETAVVPESLAGWNVARAIAVLPVRRDVSAYWLQLALRAPTVKALIDSRLNTTVQATLNLRDLATLPISLPPCEDRNRIITVLGAHDDKIDLNRRMNETLEAMARAIFKDWFVDFGPTRAKMEGRAPYLVPEIWALFPDRLDDEGKPEGWSYGTLDLISTLNSESWGARNSPLAVRYVDLSGVKWGYIDTTTDYAWNEAPSRARRILRRGDTVLGTVRPGNGSYALVDQDGLTGSTGFAVLRPKAEHDRELVWCAATSRENIDRLTHLADGGAYPAVRPEMVAATELSVGNLRIRRAFSTLCAPLLDRIEANKREAQTLAATRDLLLPKLMSGEIRVKDAEKLAEAAA